MWERILDLSSVSLTVAIFILQKITNLGSWRQLNLFYFMLELAVSRSHGTDNKILKSILLSLISLPILIIQP